MPSCTVSSITIHPVQYFTTCSTGFACYLCVCIKPLIDALDLVLRVSPEEAFLFIRRNILTETWCIAVVVSTNEFLMFSFVAAAQRRLYKGLTKARSASSSGVTKLSKFNEATRLRRCPSTVWSRPIWISTNRCWSLNLGGVAVHPLTKTMQRTASPLLKCIGIPIFSSDYNLYVQ